VLVATDVAARGIDVTGGHPRGQLPVPGRREEPTSTGSAAPAAPGARAVAVTLVDWDEIPRWKTISDDLGLGIDEAGRDLLHLRPPVSRSSASRPRPAARLPRASRTRAGLNRRVHRGRRPPAAAATSGAAGPAPGRGSGGGRHSGETQHRRGPRVRPPATQGGPPAEARRRRPPRPAVEAAGRRGEAARWTATGRLRRGRGQHRGPRHRRAARNGGAVNELVQRPARTGGYPPAGRGAARPPPAGSGSSDAPERRGQASVLSPVAPGLGAAQGERRLKPGVPKTEGIGLNVLRAGAAAARADLVAAARAGWWSLPSGVLVVVADQLRRAHVVDHRDRSRLPSVTGGSAARNRPRSPRDLAGAQRGHRGAGGWPAPGGGHRGPGSTVVGRDPLTGAEHWSYRRNVPLCTVGAEWGPGDRACSATASTAARSRRWQANTGARGPQRKLRRPGGRPHCSPTVYLVTATGFQTTWRTWRPPTWVKTMEYGEAAGPDIQPGQPKPPARACLHALGSRHRGPVGACSSAAPASPGDRLTVLLPDETEAGPAQRRRQHRPARPAAPGLVANHRPTGRRLLLPTRARLSILGRDRQRAGPATRWTCRRATWPATRPAGIVPTTDNPRRRAVVEPARARSRWTPADLHPLWTVPRRARARHPWLAGAPVGAGCRTGPRPRSARAGRPACAAAACRSTGGDYQGPRSALAAQSARVAARTTRRWRG